MKSIAAHTLAFALLALVLLAPRVLGAQGELTLENLSARLDAVLGRVESHDERLASIETAIAPAATHTPMPAGQASLTIERRMNVRRGPSTSYQVMGTVEAGAVFDISGRNVNGDWWQIEYEGAAAWVHDDDVTAIHASDVQAVAAPTRVPTPTPRATATPAATSTPAILPEDDITIYAHIFAEDDYEGSDGSTSFYGLSKDAQEERVKSYRQLFVAALQSCGIEDRELFLMVALSAGMLEQYGVDARNAAPWRAYWLRWLVTDERTDPCKFAIVEATVGLLNKHSPGPAGTPEPRAEAVRLSRLLVLNDYTAAGHDFLALGKTEREWLIAHFYRYFVYTARLCDLNYGDAFWLIQKYANDVDRRGIVAAIGTWRDDVPGGGSRYDFIRRISSNSLLRNWVAENNCDDYLAWYTR